MNIGPGRAILDYLEVWHPMVKNYRGLVPNRSSHPGRYYGDHPIRSMPCQTCDIAGSWQAFLRRCSISWSNVSGSLTTSRNVSPPNRVLPDESEAALRWVVGGQEVMRGQLRHLAALARRPNIHIQVLPFSVGAHPGMKSPFVLLRFPEGFDDMDCVYLENENGELWQERPGDSKNPG